MTDSPFSYTFTCPSCAGSFSILLEKIPPVRARFRCPHCKKPMDFPSRDEARVYARLQQQSSEPASASPPVSSRESPRVTASAPLEDSSGGQAITDATQFRVEKQGFEMDVYDRRAVRNLIRTGEILESDRVRVDQAEPGIAGDVPYLRSLFNLKKNDRVKPPICCRTHPDRIAFFRCSDTGRPLCEDCSPEKKFGGTSIRVCQHCGGAGETLDQA